MNRWLVKQLWYDDDFDWLHFPSIGSSGGLLTIWNKSKLEKEDERMGYNTITTVLNSKQNDVRDVNAVRSHKERNRGECDLRNNGFLKNFILSLELVDLPLVGGAFTWSDMQVDPLLCRLDRFMLSVDLDLLFPDVIQIALIRVISDHKPIMLRAVPMGMNKSNTLFNQVDGQTKFSTMEKKEFGSVKKEKIELTEKIDMLDQMEESHKLSDGQIANAKKKRNTIVKLEIDGAECFIKIALSLEEVEKMEMENELSEEKVFGVVKQFGANKSPGPDGFSMSFYKHCWHILKDDVMRLMEEFYRKGVSDPADTRPIRDINYLGLKFKKPGVVCKIDMEKAFDNVKWKSLLRILEKHGFGSKWIGWMKWCISTSNISILVNGSSTDKFKPSKGLRQGDSLSPFLFLLVVEVLSKLIDDVVLRDQIHGFKVAEDGIMVSQMQFADDTLMFLDANVDEVRRLLLILTTFELLTGMKLNLEKSSMISIDIDNVIEDISLELGCKVEKLPIKYLGLPVGATARCASVWDEVIHRMEVKLATWKKKFLSKSGRLVRIRSCMPSLPVYFLSLVHMPAMVELKLTRFMRNFLWDFKENRRKMC
ncbi:uncharacterized protein LOC113358980 [Papaver somniferum]|uniref:uncharacterized protein LOC113358980 n=1 Tax=Papaver somniferum TaxID=3469 RepID=UPI000E702036|nr:uncharacterized protein LOC113358980 [Papaver somniferum]